MQFEGTLGLATMESHASASSAPPPNARPWTRAITGAVYLQGYAGDRLAERMGDRGLLAGDLIDSIPFTLKEFIPARRKLHILRTQH